jgi:hypothetical protein
MTSVLSFKNLCASVNCQCKASPFRGYAVLFEEKTNIDVAYVVLAKGILLAVLVLANVGAAWIVNISGFLYPSFMTLRYLERGNEANIASAISKGNPVHSLYYEQPCTYWLLYWTVYSSLGLLESGRYTAQRSIIMQP